MSRKPVSIVVGLVGRSLVALAFVVGALQSCGGSSSDATAECQQVCDKELMCTPDAGAIEMAANATCKSQCSSTTSGGNKCTNLGAIEAAYKTCLAMDCAGYQTCVQTTIPACQQGGGGGSGGAGAATGGTSGGGAGTHGTGGTTGGGGTSGTASCSTCTKAQPCCVGALQLFGADAGSCAFSAATCDSLTGPSQTSYISSCSTEITAGAQLGVAACQ